jgi:hypothetical protein
MKISITFLVMLSCVVMFTGDVSAKSSGGSKPSYSGSKHSSSHGGKYSGGSGSSHKGGSYKNSSSGDRYGQHKK